jgi:hypothetical protein
MVALAIGTLVVATMYTLSGTSARAFQTQQRISQLQLQTRLALERIRRDVAATGFGATPDSQRERTCGVPGLTTRFVAVGLTDHDAAATSALATMPGAPRAATHGDRLRLMGNFATSDTYLIANTGSANGASILLQSNWQAFRRTFAADPLGTTVDQPLFQSVFAPGRVLHVTHPRGFHFFTQVVGSSVTSGGQTASISISPPLPALDECNFALCIGCQVSPMMMVEYGIDTADNIAPALVPRDVGVTGTNTVLYRRELDPVSGTAIAGQPPRVILEWAVNFDVTVFQDAAASASSPPILTGATSGPLTTIPATREARLRALRVELAARTPETDPSFPFPLPGNRDPLTQPLTSFLVFTDRPGSARVRTAVAEFVLENLALRGL